MNKLLLLILFEGIIFLSCSGKGDLESGNSKVSLIIDGTFDDKSFNESALNGAKKVKEEFKIELVLKESSANSYLSDLEGLKDAGSDLIWLIGYRFSDVAKAVSLQNSDMKYAIIDPVYSTNDPIPANLVGMTFRAQEGAFLTGYIAAKVSKTGKIGFLGGIEGEIVNAFRYGYEAGARYANKDIKISTQYIGSFVDIEAGRSIATKMYSDEIDIIHHAAGLGGIGAIEVAKELGSGHYIIGVDEDQSYLAPNNVITSTTKDVGRSLNIFTSNYLKTNTFEGGKLINYGLKEGVVGFVRNPKMIPFELEKEIDSLSSKIINKEIIVPHDKESYDKFLKEFI
ncbi:nucleoside ABC transporter substrate-binding protein BmpA [Borreliella carolinensis]|uniref:Nucleoside ABC transporter substrate-binding protein BmpA n=1 Tax=Borreliella carolinensis TaxID=478174 RepID=A0ABY9E6E5_9SPIR|nr:nucleoside ABC transporter substrate-binding protein BmpA [Borreliella carolinensis]WKC90768.1 nucleoside ABC transporter substrate-binding protein BmpA [Borreliella carolinensis]WNY67702.1 nucleoside ABC transporter substrate-binding protein BmpA [Borreliella carolinensis]